MTLNHIGFYVTVLVTHIIQGITGFAGTLLAMPASLYLVGSATAVPVLNCLGLASGIYVYPKNRQFVKWKTLLIALAVMIPSMIGGVFLRQLLSSRERILYYILGAIILALSIKGFYDVFSAGKEKEKRPLPGVIKWSVLVLAGLVHGMFVCGGPLLIIYMADCLDRKEEFRATLSTSWIFLNGILLVVHLIEGLWSIELLKILLISLPVLFLAMFIGSILYRKMSQKLFTIISYFLLVISAVSLFFKT
ncbi:MAG: sulfite exporter TauE/SafE family protein [Clostridiales bacterium]|nr:sulfite exporter TauE/SafE family protein [Clostridiales bacterium]